MPEKFLVVLKTKESNLQRDVEMLNKTKSELEKHIDELVVKVTEFEEKLIKAKSMQSDEVKVSQSSL